MVETGCVLRDMTSEALVSMKTFTTDKNMSNMLRAQCLGITAAAWLERTFIVMNVPHVVLFVCVELPILRENVVNLMKQMRTVQALEAETIHAALKFCDQVYLTEVMPTASKRIATGSGSADKQDMIDVSPWREARGMKRDTVEALADAWAHSLAAGHSLVDTMQIKDEEDAAWEIA